MGRGYFFYPTDEQKSVNTGFFRAGDPNKGYITHYGHYLELSFICRNTDGLDRRQAETELKTCEDKLERLSKRPGFQLSSILLNIQKLKRDWEVSEIPDRWSGK